MSALARGGALRELLESAAILAGSYLAARLLSYVLGRVLARAAKRSATTLDDRLIQALKRPVTYALFLIGAYVAVHRLPIQDGWTAPSTTRSLRSRWPWSAWPPFVPTASCSPGTRPSRASAETGVTREFGPLLNKLGTLFVVIVATIAILQHFSVNVQSLVVSLGVGSLAVGLAAQDTLANMFAGFTLMLDRPFRIGDRIQLSTGEIGDVEAIGMRATRLKTTDDTVLIIPNNVLVKDRVVNQSHPSRHLTTRLEVAVAYGTDLTLVKQVLVEAPLRPRASIAIGNRWR